MISLQAKEYLEIRIVELVARRNAMAAFIYNSDLGQQARIIDKQILALRTILDMESIPEINDDLFEWPRWDDEGNRTDKGLDI
jgi:hypothetical protein